MKVWAIIEESTNHTCKQCEGVVFEKILKIVDSREKAREAVKNDNHWLMRAYEVY